MLKRTDFSQIKMLKRSRENSISELYQMDSQPDEDGQIVIDLPLFQLENED